MTTTQHHDLIVDEGTTLKDVVLLALLTIGKTELDLTGVFEGSSNCIASERLGGHVYVLMTDGTFVTLVTEGRAKE